MRDIIIGDIHGCYDELQLLLKEVSFAQNDNLYFVGDMINKGPKSNKVLDFAIKNNVKCILGNHEVGFLKSIKEGKFKNSFQTLREQLQDNFDQYVSFIEGLPLFLIDPQNNFIVVHAGLSPQNYFNPENESEKVITKIRTWDGKGEDLNNENDPAWYEFYKEDRLIVFGHWAKKGLIERANVIGLDTGCVYGRKLTALVLPDRKLVQVNALKTYIAI